MLLVDDNPADIDLIREVLARNRCSSDVHEVIDGVEAMAFLHRQGRYSDESLPDLVVLDLNLPRKDGRAVLAEIKADPRLRLVPIVIFSTSEAEQDILGSYELGASSYVNKPGNLQEFVLAVTSIGEFWCCSTRFAREERQ